MCHWALGGDGRLTVVIREALLSHIWPTRSLADRRIECGAEWANGGTENTGKITFRHSRKLHPRSTECGPGLLFGIEARLLGFTIVVRDEDVPRHGAIRG